MLHVDILTFLMLCSVTITVFWVFALVDCVKRDFPGPNDKVVWVLVIALGSWLGALIYWFVGRPQGTMPPDPSPHPPPLP